MKNQLKLKPIGPNCNELLTDNVSVLFSYETPVAAFVPGRGYLKSDTFYSVTTSKHINRWIDGSPVTVVPQAEIDALLK